LGCLGRSGIVFTNSHSGYHPQSASQTKLIFSKNYVKYLDFTFQGSTLHCSNNYTGCNGSPCRNFNHKENLSRINIFIYHFFRKCAVVELKLKINGTPKMVHVYGITVYKFIHNKGLKKNHSNKHKNG
jgi:hypothetical protein